jgi:predicted helicase
MRPSFDFSVLVTRGLIDQCAVGNKTAGAGISYLGPLLAHADAAGPMSMDDDADDGSCSNMSPVFIASMADAVGSTVDPETALHYTYGILSAPSYRQRYEPFLKSDFPRIPLTSDRELFRELCRLGARLVKLHLMEAHDLAPITTYPVPGDNRVEKVRYTEPGQGADQGRVWINATQHFEGVPTAVWEFHVGGYQVCAKWLKDRKGRQLGYDDLTHYQYVAAALAETIALMREIDEVIEAHGGWPLS